MGHRDLLVTRTYLRQTPNARVCSREASAGRLSSSGVTGNWPETAFVGNRSFLVIRESPIPGENSHRTGNSAARSRRAPILAPGSGAVAANWLPPVRLSTPDALQTRFAAPRMV